MYLQVSDLKKWFKKNNSRIESYPSNDAFETIFIYVDCS